jgi:hypothetical protein
LCHYLQKHLLDAFIQRQRQKAWRDLGDRKQRTKVESDEGHAVVAIDVVLLDIRIDSDDQRFELVMNTRQFPFVLVPGPAGAG